MKRRDWLQIAGIAGAGMVLNPLDVLANPHLEEYDLINTDSFIRLSSNENPFGPSENVRKAMINAFDLGCRYPYGKMNDLAELIAKKEGVSREHIVMAAGSTEGLKATGLTFAKNGGEIIAADPVYKALLVYAAQFGAEINRVPLDKNMGHDLDEMEKRVSYKTTLVFVCNPNNPSGTLIEKNRLIDFCNRVSRKTLLFSDEAYYDYITEPGYPSMVELVKEDKQVIVSRTFSKVYGLAGLRVGYLIARPDIAESIRRNVMAKANMMGLIAAEAAMNETDFYKMSLAKNHEARQYLYGLFDSLGLQYVPSHTNFVFFKPGMDIRELIPKMREKNIGIGRPFPPLYDWCRISTGRLQEVRKFGDALTEVLSK